MANGMAINFCKSSYSAFADGAGLNVASRGLHRESVVVLSYHGVIPDELADHPLRSSFMVTATEFRQHLTEIVRLFNPISATDLRVWLQGELELPGKALLITFDDGYANNLAHAAPLLMQMGVPAIFFLPTGYIGCKRMLWSTEVFYRIYNWPEREMPLPEGKSAVVPKRLAARSAFALKVEEACKRLSLTFRDAYLARLRAATALAMDKAVEDLFGFLNWDGVRALRKKGFEIGSHTVTHPIVSRIPLPQLAHEMQLSKATIEQEAGSDCFCLAYPNGGADDISPAAMQAAADAGYEFAFSLMDGVCRRSANRLLLDRIWIPGRIGVRELRTRTSGIHGALKRLLRPGGNHGA